MNQTINVGGSAGLSLGVAVAGILLAYGLWVGRRDLGMRAALGILGTAPLAVISSLAFLFVPLSPARGTLTGMLFLLLMSALSLLLSFLPLYVAANWLEVIRDTSRLENRTENPPA